MRPVESEHERLWKQEEQRGEERVSSSGRGRKDGRRFGDKGGAKVRRD